LARGYEPDPDPPLSIEAVVSISPGESKCIEVEEVQQFLGERCSRGIGLLLPTFVRRCSLSEQADAVERILEQLRITREANPELPLLFVVGMQWQGDGEHEEALRRLETLGGIVGRGGFCSYLGLCVPGPGKNRTINASLEATASLELLGWLWTDDDVECSPGCIQRLVTEFVNVGCRGAVGAQTVIRSADGDKWGRRVSWAKKMTVVQRAYPHACCMLVERSVIEGGIPKRRYSDDGFVFFRLLRPGDPDPFRDLHMVQDAFCYIPPENRPRNIFRRWRRLIYSHLICLGDESPENAGYYFRQMLFYGLWPIAPWDGRNGLRAGVIRWGIKAVYFVWFCGEASLLSMRGIARRPLRSVQW
jgi:hypothetical protein